MTIFGYRVKRRANYRVLMPSTRYADVMHEYRDKFTDTPVSTAKYDMVTFHTSITSDYLTQICSNMTLNFKSLRPFVRRLDLVIRKRKCRSVCINTAETS